jgi:septum formation protein
VGFDEHDPGSLHIDVGVRLGSGETMPALILASASPRRLDLLQRIGLSIDVRPADIDESWHDGELPASYVARVAAAKLEAVQAPGRWVLAADTTVTIDGAVLGKAADEAEAREMLQRLSGRAHQVMTGFALRGPSVAAAEVVTTDVVMTALSTEQIEQYLTCGEWRGKAGAYAIQGIGSVLVAAVRGSVTNVIGLPLAEVVACLARLGGPAPQFHRGLPE